MQFFYLSPQGEFALNDDWVHTDTIKHWAQTGEFRLMPYAGPTFYVPILYGTAITKIFVFSFTSLRISTLVLTILLLSTFYFLLQKLSNKPALAFFGTLALWFNPIFYNLSFTFMTDIPALAFLILAIYFYYTGFEKENNKYLFWGTIFGLLSAFTRQTGILIIAAGLIYSLANSKKFPNLKLKNLLISFGLPLAIGGIIYTWLSVYQLIPQNTGSHIIQGTWRLFGHIKWWLFYIPMYLGLFLLPLTLAWFLKHHTEWFKKRNLIIFTLITILTIAIRQIWHLQFPYIGNIISYYGIGPLKYLLNGELNLLLPSYIWGIISIICGLGFTLLISIFSHRRHNQEPTGFIYLFGAFYLIPIFLFESFDRYLLPLLLVLIIALIQNIKHVKFSYIVSLILIFSFAFISLTQTKFYLKINDARWQLANEVSTLTTDKTTIDGGYEWNGWNNYWSTLQNEKITFTEAEIQLKPWSDRRFFPVQKPQYLISLSPEKDYHILKEKIVEKLNPNNHIYLLQATSTKPVVN